MQSQSTLPAKFYAAGALHGWHYRRRITVRRIRGRLETTQARRRRDEERVVAVAAAAKDLQ